MESIRREAEKARAMYRRGEISRKQAKEMMAPFEMAYNEKSKELAKKYNVKAHKFNFSAYVR